MKWIRAYLIVPYFYALLTFAVIDEIREAAEGDAIRSIQTVMTSWLFVWVINHLPNYPSSEQQSNQPNQ